MITRNLLIASIICFPHFLFGQNESILFEDDPNVLHLKGAIDELQSKTYRISIVNGKIRKSAPETSNDGWLYRFQKNGTIKERYISTSTNKLLNTVERFTYDSSRLLIKISKETLNDNYSESYSFGYTAEGLLISRIRNNPGITILNTREHFTFDKLNRLVGKETYRDDSSRVNRHSYSYNTQGDIVLSTYATFSNNKEYAAVYKYEYNNLNQKASEFEYMGNGDWRLIKTNFYDTLGNVSSIKEQNKDVRYTYDRHGNWIERIEYQNDLPILLTERKIKYFD